MRIFTYGELNTKIRADMDINDTIALPDSEMVGLVNDAIDEAEAEIHKLGAEDDYFLTSKAVTLASGTSVYPLATMAPNIYGTKIRAFMYENGTNIYEIKRIRRLNKFLKIAEIKQWGSADDYSYILTNELTDRSTTQEDATNDAAINVNLLPAARESGAVAKLWYIRNAMRVPLTSNTTFKLDIPEFSSFIQASVKRAICLKFGDPRFDVWNGEKEKERKLMIDTLTPMVEDDDDKIELDTSIYEEMN